MHTLTVLYDPRCNLCSGLRSWLKTQPTYVTLEFLAAGSNAARQRFPQLDHSVTAQELTVISDAGAVYLDANAFLICLWALRDYRAWSLRLAAPEMVPLARRVLLWVSHNRSRFGTRSLDEILADDTTAIECVGECRVQ